MPPSINVDPHWEYWPFRQHTQKDTWRSCRRGGWIFLRDIWYIKDPCLKLFLFYPLLAQLNFNCGTHSPVCFSPLLFFSFTMNHFHSDKYPLIKGQESPWRSKAPQTSHWIRALISYFTFLMIFINTINHFHSHISDQGQNQYHKKKVQSEGCKLLPKVERVKIG